MLRFRAKIETTLLLVLSYHDRLFYWGEFMGEKSTCLHEISDAEKAGSRRPWVEPQLARRECLPRVTNGIAGSFDPDGGLAPRSETGSGGGATARDWSDEP